MLYFISSGLLQLRKKFQELLKQRDLQNIVTYKAAAYENFLGA